MRSRGGRPRNLTFAALSQTGRSVVATPGAYVALAVSPQERDVIVVKHREGAFSGTDLEMTLRAKGSDTLVLLERSVGSVGDSYDNALAESIIGFFKTEVIRRRGPWRSIDAVEYATLEWVDWFNNRRLLEPIGYVPPAEFEAAYYRGQSRQAIAA